MIKCKRCGLDGGPNGVGIDFHHKVPKFIGGKDADGRVYLCKLCHKQIHSLVSKRIFEFVKEEDLPELRSRIKQHTEWWIDLGR